MKAVHAFRALCGFIALVVAGCGSSTPEQRLAGTWKGAPQVTEAVDQVVQSAAQGEKVNPLAHGAARFLGNAFAKVALSIEMDLRPSGAVFFRGNTDALGLPPDCDGTWDLLSADEDQAKVEFEINGQTIPGRIVFRNADEFTLKIEPRPVAAAPPATGIPAAAVGSPATAPASGSASSSGAATAPRPAVPVPAASVRAKDADDDPNDDEDDDDAKPAAFRPPAPSSAAPASGAVKAAAPPAMQPAVSIVFKRSSG